MSNYLNKLFLAIVMAVLLFPTDTLAQDVIPTKGKEFWVGFMENYTSYSESLDLFITSDQNTSGTVSIPLQGWTLDFNVTANVTTTVTVPSNLAEHLDENQIISQKGVFVETADTVSVFAINFEPFTADGTKILPTKALGTSYRVSSYTGLSGNGSELLVVATEDGTEVEITPSVDTDGGNPAGVPFTVQLDRGESYQIIQNASGDDLTGTTIIGTEASGTCRPFAVFSGVSCTNVPVGCTYCDHIFEQNFSSDTWGTEYYIVPYVFASGYTYRVLADQDGTQVTINGGAPITLNAGEYEEFNQVNEAVCVTSDLPVSVTQYMQGTSCSGSGDPAMLILNDASQKIDNVTFSTVISPQITDHGLNVIIETTDVGSFTIDGVAIDNSEFSQFPSCPTHSFAQLTITEGSHTLDAPNGFTAYSFGLGNAESYSYSVGSFSPNPFGDIEIEEAFCSTDQVVLSVEDPGFDTYWYHIDFPEDTLGTDPTLILEQPINVGIYVAAYNTLVSGCSSEEYFSVEVPDPPILESLTEDQVICQYESVQLNVDPVPANSFYQYSWSPTIGLSNPNIQNPVASPLSTTTYTVTVTSPTGCATSTNEVVVTVEGGEFSNMNAITEDNTICTGESSQCDIEINQVFFDDNFDPGISWGLWESIDNGSESNVCGSIDGNALYFNGNGNREAVTNPVDVSEGGTISFALQYGEGVAPCDNPEPGDDVVLEYSTNGVNWTTIQTFFSFSFSGWNQYQLDIPDGAFSANTQFRWRQLANSGIDTDNWSIDNIAISAPSDEVLEYFWYPSEGLSGTDIPNPIATPLEDVTYFVEVTDVNTGCTYLDSIPFSVGQNFVLDITPDTVVCDIQGIQLEAMPNIDGDYTYSWSPDDGSLSSVFSANPVATPVATTMYSVEVTSDQGCVNTGEVEVTVNQLLDLSITTADDELCLGESTTLNANVLGNPPDIEFEWTPAESLDDATLSNPLATPTGTTTYEVVATDINSGCSLSEDIEIEVSGNFSVDLGEDIITCDAEGLELTAIPSVVGNYTWSWSPAAEVTNANSPVTNVVNNNSNVFTVSATEDGCTQSDDITVTVIFENFDLGPDVEICQGEEVTLSTGFDDAEHLWNTTETTSEITVGTEQLYEVTVTSDLGCDVSDNIYVTVHDLPAVDLGPDVELCVGDNLTIDAENPGDDYLWSTTEVSQVINVTDSDTYSVEVTDDNGCVNSDDIAVIFHELPLALLPADSTFCVDQSVTLDALNSGSSYVWSPNAENTQTITVNQTGIYGVTVTNPEGCSIYDETEIFVETYPALELGPDLFACDGESILLESAAAPGLNVTWSTEETTSDITVNQTAVYTVTVDNDYCFSTDQVSVYFNPLPVNNLPEELLTCFVTNIDPVVLDAANPGSLYEWSTGADSQAIVANFPGIYSVDVTTALGCTSTFDVIVEELCYGPYLYVPNAFTPNGDGDNDAWRAEGIFVVDFDVQIFNRWGEIIFESNDVNEYWLGNHKNGDYYVEAGVYTYQIKFKYILNEFGTVSDWSKQTGTITVIR